MDVFEAIARRHSYRGEFADQAVPREDLRKIVEAGIRAPSGCNAQTTTFVIIDDEAVLERIRDVIPGTFRAMIACVAEPQPVYQGMSFEKEDCSAAVENMLLAITALGYATCWLDGILRRGGRAEGLAEILKVPPGKRVQVVLPVGVPKETWQQKEKKAFEERASFNRYVL